MPGVISAMAEAATGDASEEGIQKLFKMMEEGQVSSSAVLGKFAKILDDRAREGGAYQKAIKASAAEQARFNSSFDQLVTTFGEGGFEEGQANIFSMLASYLKELVPLVEAFGGAWKYVGEVMRIPMGLISDFSFGLDRLSDKTGASKSELLGIGALFTVGAIGKAFPRANKVMWSVLRKAGWLTVMEDVTGFLSGRDSLIGALLGDEKDTKRVEVLRSIEGSVESISRLTDMIKQGWIEIFDLFDSNPASAVVGTMEAIANHVTATSEAALRVAKAFGYEEPISEEQKLREVQERAERPKSSWEMTVENLKNVIRYPFGIGAPDDEKTALRKIQNAAGTTGGNPLNPFFMSDEQVSESYLPKDQFYRLGGSQQPITPMTNITFENGSLVLQAPQTDDEAIEIGREIKRQMDSVTQKGSGSPQ